MKWAINKKDLGAEGSHKLQALQYMLQVAMKVSVRIETQTDKLGNAKT